MGYTNAGVVLPDALIREIQRYRLFREGNSVSILSESFFLSEKSIYRIVSQMKR